MNERLAISTTTLMLMLALAMSTAATAGPAPPPPPPGPAPNFGVYKPGIGTALLSTPIRPADVNPRPPLYAVPPEALRPPADAGPVPAPVVVTGK